MMPHSAVLLLSVLVGVSLGLHIRGNVPSVDVRPSGTFVSPVAGSRQRLRIGIARAGKGGRAFALGRAGDRGTGIGLSESGIPGRHGVYTHRRGIAIGTGKAGYRGKAIGFGRIRGPGTGVGIGRAGRRGKAVGIGQAGRRGHAVGIAKVGALGTAIAIGKGNDPRIGRAGGPILGEQFPPDLPLTQPVDPLGSIGAFPPPVEPIGSALPLPTDPIGSSIGFGPQVDPLLAEPIGTAGTSINIGQGSALDPSIPFDPTGGPVGPTGFAPQPGGDFVSIGGQGGQEPFIDPQLPAGNLPIASPFGRDPGMSIQGPGLNLGGSSGISLNFGFAPGGRGPVSVYIPPQGSPAGGDSFRLNLPDNIVMQI